MRLFLSNSSRSVLVHQGDAEQGIRALKKVLQIEGISPGKKRYFKSKSQKRVEKKVSSGSNFKFDNKRLCNGFLRKDKKFNENSSS